MKEKVFSDMIKEESLVYMVGGNTDANYLSGVNKLAKFFIENNLTLVWGDDVESREDKTNVVACLANEIVKNGGIAPIQVVQDGEPLMIFAALEESAIPEKDKRLQKIVDDNGVLLGYENTGYNDGKGRLIHTNKQQDRSKLYYSNADYIINLDGAYGAGYEIITQVIYKFSGDIQKQTPIITIDNNNKFSHLIDAYISMSNNSEARQTVSGILKSNYFAAMGNFIYNLDKNNTLTKPTEKKITL